MDNILVISHGARPRKYICGSEGGQHGLTFEEEKKIKLFHHLSDESQRSLCMNFFMLLCSFGFSIQISIYFDNIVCKKWAPRKSNGCL